MEGCTRGSFSRSAWLLLWTPRRSTFRCVHEIVPWGVPWRRQTYSEYGHCYSPDPGPELHKENKVSCALSCLVMGCGELAHTLTTIFSCHFLVSHPALSAQYPQPGIPNKHFICKVAFFRNFVTVMGSKRYNVAHPATQDSHHTVTSSSFRADTPAYIVIRVYILIPFLVI